jgi:NADH-quinone oxidoreductase subunit F
VLERILSGGGRPSDIDLLTDITKGIFGRAFCALGDGACSPIDSSVKFFRDEYEYLIEHGRLPDGIEPHAGPVTQNSGHLRPNHRKPLYSPEPAKA